MTKIISEHLEFDKDGFLTHKRWLNPDGSRKTGLALEEERVRVQLEKCARMLLKLYE